MLPSPSSVFTTSCPDTRLLRANTLARPFDSLPHSAHLLEHTASLCPRSLKSALLCQICSEYHRVTGPGEHRRGISWSLGGRSGQKEPGQFAVKHRSSTSSVHGTLASHKVTTCCPLALAAEGRSATFTCSALYRVRGPSLRLFECSDLFPTSTHLTALHRAIQSYCSVFARSP